QYAAVGVLDVDGTSGELSAIARLRQQSAEPEIVSPKPIDGARGELFDPFEARSIPALLAPVIASIACRAQNHLCPSLPPDIAPVLLHRESALKKMISDRQPVDKGARVVSCAEAWRYRARIEEIQVCKERFARRDVKS